MDIVTHMIGEITGGILIKIDEEGSLPDDFGTVFLGISDQSLEIMCTFLEEHDFTENTMIPFLVTEEGNLEDIMDTLYQMEPESEFLDGIIIDRNCSGDRKPEVIEWLSGLGYNN